METDRLNSYEKNQLLQDPHHLGWEPLVWSSWASVGFPSWEPEWWRTCSIVSGSSPGPEGTHIWPRCFVPEAQLSSRPCSRFACAHYAPSATTSEHGYLWDVLYGSFVLFQVFLFGYDWFTSVDLFCRRTSEEMRKVFGSSCPCWTLVLVQSYRSRVRVPCLTIHVSLRISNVQSTFTRQVFIHWGPSSHMFGWL